MTSIRPVGPKATPEVRDAIQVAARRTGVSFDFLVKQAETESGFDPRAKASTSSATGLYQFLEGTWLSMVRQHGAGERLNLGQEGGFPAQRMPGAGRRLNAAAYRSVDHAALRALVISAFMAASCARIRSAARSAA